jgi:D-arginine dehydrogenase
MQSFDVLVVGGGIAGVSVACELAAERRVALIEMESALAYHTTGRSAAMFLESYGGPAIRALTTASRDFLTEPAWTFDRPLLKPLAMLHTAGPGRSAAIRELYGQVKVLVPDVELIEADDVAARQPLLRPGHVELALLEPRAMEIDVNALHEGFRREFGRRGGQVARSAAAQHAERRNREWIVTDTRAQQWRWW